MKKISFVCTTFRRFTCVERIITQYYTQTYKNKELIIFNTDMEYPMSLDFVDDNIKVVNNNTNYESGEPYKNRGEICRDAVTHATGDYFMLADDDDIYLPWHMQQAVDKIQEVEKDAWKPQESFFATKHTVELVRNTMEASVIIKMNRIREIGFRTDKTGMEGLSWYTKLRDENQLNEHYRYCVPSYCFNWGDPPHLAGHKQSGNINNPNNFEEHKLKSTDYAYRPLQYNEHLGELYNPYYEYFRTHRTKFPERMMEKYVNQYL